MNDYDDESLPLSVKELRARAAGIARRLEAEGETLSPVGANGRSIARSFWGKAWCRNIESYQDYESRLPRGRSYLRNGTVIDIGGQDTKGIALKNGRVMKLIMNDKCSAGTGKFLEIMANRLGVTINELFDMAAAGEVIPISSLCTVFAESEVINYIGEGKKREDIAAGVVDSVANKVVQLAQKKELGDRVILTGGLSHSIYFTGILSDKLDQKVESEEFGRFAGAYGAALLAREKKDKRR